MKPYHIILGAAILMTFSFVAKTAEAAPSFFSQDWFKHKSCTITAVFNEEYKNHPWRIADIKGEKWVLDDFSFENRVAGYYHIDIFRDQYLQYTARHEECGVPILEVGPVFYRLGKREQAEALEIVDVIHGITALRDGVIILRDWNTGKDIGVYTNQGMSLY